MKAFLVFLAVLIGAVAYAYPRYFSADARHHRAASELIQRLRMDEFTHAGFIASYRHMNDKGKVSDPAFACIEESSARDFNDVLAKLLARDMTRYEIESAERFYRSPSGERYTRMLLTEFNRVGDTQMATDGPEPTLDMDDILKLDEFVKSYKARGRHEPMYMLVGYTIDDSVTALVKKINDRCIPPKR